MGNNAISPYQQVIEKTKSLSFRSQMLAMNIEKKQSLANRNEVKAAEHLSFYLISSLFVLSPAVYTHKWSIQNNVERQSAQNGLYTA